MSSIMDLFQLIASANDFNVDMIFQCWYDINVDFISYKLYGLLILLYDMMKVASFLPAACN